jgi:hypothetical protein
MVKGIYMFRTLPTTQLQLINIIIIIIIITWSSSGGRAQAAIGILRACYVSWLHQYWNTPKYFEE